MRFISEDGRKTLNLDENEYAAFVKRQREIMRQKKENDARKIRYEEIQNVQCAVESLIEAYEKDYGLKISFGKALDPIEYLSRMFG